MNAKLTLNLNKDIIGRAKEYARENSQSLSALVQNYFVFLSEKNNITEMEISLNVKELSGIINLTPDFDLEDEYGSHILEKYK
jgi:hypothetical protein